MPHAEPISQAALLLVTLAGLSLGACSTTSPGDHGSKATASVPDTDGNPTLALISPAIAELIARAERERSDSSLLERNETPPPTGLDTALVAPLSDPRPPEADQTLAELLPLLRAELPTKPLPPLDQPASEDAKLQALRLYARARSTANADQPTAALADVDAALKLDPRSPELWRLRADILTATAQRLGATTAYQRVLDLGLIDSRACYALAAAASERQDHLAAARYLATALDAHHPGQDPAFPLLVSASLGISLHKLGYLHAGNESLLKALRQPLQFTTSTAYRNDLQTFARRRSDLFRDVGDACMRLGHIADAIMAYEQADASIAFDPSSITARRVYTLVVAGRPAQASLTLLQEIASAELRADDQQLNLLAYLARHTTLRATLADALTQLPEYARSVAASQNLDAPRITPTIQSRLARAAVVIATSVQSDGHTDGASLSGKDRANALSILSKQLILAPDDLDVARAFVSLLESVPDENARSLARSQTHALVERQPFALLTLAEELARSEIAIQTFLSTPSRTPMPPASAPTEMRIRAAIQIAQGSWADASATIRSVRSTDDTLTPDSRSPGSDAQPPAESVVTLDALIAAATGDESHAETLLASLISPRNRARVLHALQRPAAARDALADPAQWTEDTRTVQDEILDFEISMLERDANAAAEALTRAIKIDPFDESLYDRLSGLYRQGAPLADQELLFATYRELRQNVPSSRVLRTLSAQEAAQRNALASAEQELVSLVQQDPDDIRALQTLITVWERMATSDSTTTRMQTQTQVLQRAESFLSELRERMPGASTPVIALARIQTLDGRATQAEALLRNHLSSFPSPETAEALESLLRDALSRSDEANELAVARLSPYPRPMEATIDLATILISLDRVSDAADVLEEHIPADAILTAGQSASFMLMIADPASKASSGTTDPSGDAGVLRLLNLAAARQLQLPPALHEIRLVLLCQDPSSTPDQILKAATLASDQVPQLGERSILRVLAALAEANRLNDALDVLLGSIELTPDVEPSADLAMNIVRLVIATGDASHLDRLLGRVTSRDLLSTILSPIHPDGSEAFSQEDTIDEGRAEIAFIVANYLAISESRTRFADDLYRLSLRYNPRHAMAANNLGYTLLDENRNIEEAEQLLELAHAIEPDDPNIADSLGWLRYQQGILQDSTDPDGTPIEGALTLLSNSMILDSESGSPVTLDHYADALWASGDPDGATLHWEQALATLERTIQANAREARVDPTHGPLRQSILNKLAAVRDGTPPPIAPMRLAPSTSSP